MSRTDTSFNEAKQLYLEKYGDAITTGTYLKATVAVLSLIVLGLVLLNVKTVQTFRNWRPLVIRVDDIGRAQALDYRSLEYHPGDAEAKYFLSEFCRLYYRRNRYTINDDFTKALYFSMARSPTTSSSNRSLRIRSTNSFPIRLRHRSTWTCRRSPYSR